MAQRRIARGMVRAESTWFGIVVAEIATPVLDNFTNAEPQYQSALI